MGFKPRSSVKTYHHIRPAQFLYPSEKVEKKLVFDCYVILNANQAQGIIMHYLQTTMVFL